MKNRLSKLEDYKQLKEREIKVWKELKEIKELEQDFGSFKILKQYYTPSMRNYYEKYGSLEEPRKPKNKPLLKKQK